MKLHQDVTNTRVITTFKTLEQRFISTHGTKYDYSNAIFIKVKSNIEIICPIHGTFSLWVSSHLKGKGCQKCGWAKLATNRTLTSTEFIVKSESIHNNTYDYSKVNYRKGTENVAIICRQHGIFLQTPNTHLRGGGCQICSGAKKKTTEEFILAATAVHKDRYAYSNTIYINAKTKLSITCKVHGDFLQEPNSHLKGMHCYKCSGIARRYTTEEFVIKANKVHSNEYTYDKTDIINFTMEKVIITCKTHGDFLQLGYSHLDGHGCPDCGGGFNPSKPGYLYYLKVTLDNGKSIFKIGITNKTVQGRFSLTELKKIEVIKLKLFPIGKDALDLEQKILKLFKEYKYTGSKVLVTGNTELFTVDIMKLINNDKDFHEFKKQNNTGEKTVN